MSAPPAARNGSPIAAEAPAIPPHDEEAERALLSAFLHNPTMAAEKAGPLYVDDFWGECERVIFATIRRLHARGSLDDVVEGNLLLVTSELRRAGEPGTRALAVLYEVAASGVQSANAEPLAKVVRQAAAQRRLHSLLHEVRQATETSAEYAAEVVRRGLEEFAFEHAPAPAAPLPWRTLADIRRAATARPREWLLPRILYFGSVAVLIGGPKVAGKSTLFLGIVAAARRGEDLFGRPLPCGPVRAVLLSEEEDVDFDEKRQALGLSEEDEGLLVLSRSHLPQAPTWAESIRAATAKCIETGARILGVDTFYRWAQFAGDDAMKSSGVLAALDALSEAKREGILVLMIHHAAKGAGAAGREGGAAGLGSISQAGETEVNIELRPLKDRDKPHHRVLHVESRARGVFEIAVAFVRGDPDLGTFDHYEEVGDPGALARASAADRIVAFVLEHPGATGKEVQEGAGPGKGQTEDLLPQLCAPGGRLCRTGRGQRGDPYRYFPVGASPPPGAGFSPMLPNSPSGENPRGVESDSPLSPPAPPKGGEGEGENHEGADRGATAFLPSPGAGENPGEDRGAPS